MTCGPGVRSTPSSACAALDTLSTIAEASTTAAIGLRAPRNRLLSCKTLTTPSSIDRDRQSGVNTSIGAPTMTDGWRHATSALRRCKEVVYNVVTAHDGRTQAPPNATFWCLPAPSFRDQNPYSGRRARPRLSDEYLSDSQRGRAAGPACPAGWPTVDLTFKRNEEIKVNVWNATERPGLADAVATDLTYRSVRVVAEGNAKIAVDGVVLLRYGPAAVGSAHVVGAHFLNAAELRYEPTRTDDVVDVLIGAGFKQLATRTEFSASIAELAAAGRPALPPRSWRRPTATAT
ncbi:LytR C-terminal domain-containing protein [Asanoa sp. NPDC049518]|uniref:LytR C-terminal domain-containing protein n=1 Tax=unclassified Asanoa TaxID=2685164 RepID=UPI0034445B2C